MVGSGCGMGSGPGAGEGNGSGSGSGDGSGWDGGPGGKSGPGTGYSGSGPGGGPGGVSGAGSCSGGSVRLWGSRNSGVPWPNCMNIFSPLTVGVESRPFADSTGSLAPWPGSFDRSSIVARDATVSPPYRHHECRKRLRQRFRLAMSRRIEVLPTRGAGARTNRSNIFRVSCSPGPSFDNVSCIETSQKEDSGFT